jgi:hypothetical protein
LDQGPPGEFDGSSCKLSKARFKCPLGIAIVSGGDKIEHLVVCNNGSKQLLVLLNVHDLTNKSCSWIVPTWSKSGPPTMPPPTRATIGDILDAAAIEGERPRDLLARLRAADRQWQLDHAADYPAGKKLEDF